MSFFPERTDQDIIRTGMMRAAKRRTFAVHKRGGLVVWSGDSRIGKTTTAEWLEEEIESRYSSDNPNAFRGLHYEVGELGRRASNGHTKKALRSLHHATLGRLDEGIFRSAPPEDLARLIVHGFKRRRLEMVFVDEVGLYTPEAIRGLVLVGDWARKMDHRLTLVLIGMDDLEATIAMIPQVERRVREWICYDPPEVEETAELLACCSGLFSERSLEDPETHELVEWIHERHGGLPGLILPFLERLEGRIGGQDLTLEVLHVTHNLTNNDRNRIRGTMKPEEKE